MAKATSEWAGVEEGEHREAVVRVPGQMAAIGHPGDVCKTQSTWIACLSGPSM